MSVVHASRGRLDPGQRAPALRGRDRRRHRRGDPRRPVGRWTGRARADYRGSAQHIERVVPGFEDYEAPGADQDRRLRAAAPAARPPQRSTRRPARRSSRSSPMELLEVPPGHLVLQTLRSHDQFNTTIYGLSDRYRGIEGGRRVVMVNRRDLGGAWPARRRPRRHRGALAGRRRDRRVRDFRVVEYATPRRHRGGVLPRDQPARSAGLRRRGQQHPDLEVGDGATGTVG